MPKPNGEPPSSSSPPTPPPPQNDSPGAREEPSNNDNNDNASNSSSSLPPSERLYNRSSAAATTTTSTNSSSSSSGSSSSDEATQNDAPSTELSATAADQVTPRPPSAVVHGHILPSGWICKYDSQTDQYEFEFRGDDGQLIAAEKDSQPVDADGRRHRHPTAVTATTTRKTEGPTTMTKDEAVEVRTPTADHDVQTSRRPTLNLFECKYGYHFPTSPTPSMISELAKQVQKNSGTVPVAKMRQVGYGRSKLTMLSDEEEQARRLKEMFPTATGPIVDQMIRIYHGREGLIKAALISLGYKRASEYNAQEATAQSPIMLMMSKPSSKKLFDKLVGYFPDKDEAMIKNLMYTHKEVEHEIISALVESSQASEIMAKKTTDRKSRTDGGHKLDTNGVIMKLRYLKFLFPSCEETDLYHLLHCNDLNAQKVIEIVEKKGHKRANIDEVMQNRKSQTQQMRAQQAALAAKEKAPIVDPVEAHKKRTKPVVNEARTNNLKGNLKKAFEGHADELLLKALEAADYNEGLAKRFLDEMGPIDDDLYTQRYEFHRDQEAQVYLFPCKGIQKDDTSFMAITGNEYVAIDKEIIECTTALALLKVDACTFTQDDFEAPRLTHALGRRADLAKGSIFKELEVKDSLRCGPKEGLRSGARYEQVCADQTRPAPNQKAHGRNERLPQGSKLALRCGHNAKLIQRVHPFFAKPRSSFGVS